jgi:small subunit ribosomal protein S1
MSDQQEPAKSDNGTTPSPSQPAPAASQSGDDDVTREMSGVSDADVAALMSAAPPSADVPDAGTDLVGRVVGTGGDIVFLDVGLRSQAQLPIEQLEEGFDPSPGASIDVVVDRYDGDSDTLRVRRKGAVQSADIGTLQVGALVEGRISGMIRGGLEVQFGSLRGFMPASQVDPARIKDVSVFLGEQVRCEVLEIDKRGKNIVVSRRKVREKELCESRDKLLADLAPGQKLKGIVTNLTDYGAFVDLGGVHGLLHVSDMRWSQVDKPSDVVSPGDEIEVVVLKVNADRERISLSLRESTPDPWGGVENEYPEGTTLKVRVLKLAEYGAFAEVAEGITGLIPISEMSWSRIGKPQEVVDVGKMVDVVVIKVDKERRRISLSMKQTGTDPWQTFETAFPVNATVAGKVTKFLDFGVLVELAGGIEGMVHISELAHTHVKNPGEVVKEGEEITVKVLGIDTKKHKISLSLKATLESPEASVEAAPAAAPKKKRKKPLRGGLASHFEW